MRLPEPLGCKSRLGIPLPIFSPTIWQGRYMYGTILNVDCGIQDLSFYLLLDLGIPSIFLPPLHRASRTRPIWMSIIRGGASYVTNCVSRPAASRPLAACLTRVLCRPVADQSRAALPCFAVAFVMTCETPLSIVSRHLGCYAFFLCAARFRGTKLFYSSPSSASVLSQILPCAFLSHGSRFSNSFVAGGISA